MRVVALSISVFHIAVATFRPPAIPLVTTDPYLQSFVMGDTATDGVVKHWDQRNKEMLGLIRIDGTVYRYLGDCGKTLAPAGPAEYHEDKEMLGLIRIDG